MSLIVRNSATILLLMLNCAQSYAQQSLSPRLQIATSLFPSIVAADKNLDQKIDILKRLNLYLVYKSNAAIANRISQKMNSISKIRNIPVRVEVISQNALLQMEKPVKGALFVTESIPGNLPWLIKFSSKNQLLLFSPFKGDVERGVAAGLRVTEKVLPLVNVSSLNQANIRLKAFFLRIAVKYEQ